MQTALNTAQHTGKWEAMSQWPTQHVVYNLWCVAKREKRKEQGEKKGGLDSSVGARKI